MRVGVTGAVILGRIGAVAVGAGETGADTGDGTSGVARMGEISEGRGFVVTSDSVGADKSGFASGRGAGRAVDGADTSGLAVVTLVAVAAGDVTGEIRDFVVVVVTGETVFVGEIRVFASRSALSKLVDLVGASAISLPSSFGL